tara:strand:+ start:1324 stop:2424 length:1101 start_codon:yes stop_codon:yes gene_type:complete
MRKIPYVSLQSQWIEEKKDLQNIFKEVMSSGEFVGGRYVNKFESQIAKYCGTKYAASFNSGTDALTMALYISGIKRGDEVITPPNSFISSTSVIAHLGAIPVFCDVLADQNIDPLQIEKLITKNTKAILPVHLTGRISEMKIINELAKKYNLKVIEDSAQAIGSKYYSKKSGSLSDIGCFSTHPLKNLNASGDGGFFTTNSKKFWQKAKEISNLGLINRNKVNEFGHVSRMDNLQAAILTYRLGNLNSVIKRRRKNAKFYIDNLNKDNIFYPKEESHQFNTYHTFVIQVKKRDQLKKYLDKKGIQTAIHYPRPIHLQPATKRFGYKVGDFPITEKQAKRIITLPIHQYLSTDDLKYIVKSTNEFFD